MTHDLPTASLLTEGIIVTFGILLFILTPGKALADGLKIDRESFLEGTVFALALGFISLHILAFCVFLTGSNIPWYMFAGACLGYFLWLLYRVVLNQFWRRIKIKWNENFQGPATVYYICYSLLIISILVYLEYFLSQGYFVWGKQGELLGFRGHWDNLFQTTMMNESRNYFFANDNPFLPGEMPFYYNWLGSLFPIFLVKCLGIDQTHAYFRWSPPFFHVSMILFIHYLAGQFTRDKWAPFFAVGLFFFTPAISLAAGVHQIRYLAGYFLVFCALFFILKYLATKRTMYIALSFCWAFLYVVKVNFLLGLFPGLVAFYFYALFQENFPRWNNRMLKVLFLCSTLPLFLLWFSKTSFGILFIPDSIFVFDFARAIGRITSFFLAALPLLLVFVFYQIKLFKEAKESSPVVFLSWITLGGICLFSALAGKHIDGGASHLVFFGLLIALPVIVRRLIPKEALYKFLGGGCLVPFVIFFFHGAIHAEDLKYTAMTKDELAVIKFIRNETPEDSVILYNVYRYNDRPAIMSSLTYRKSFIDEGERFANVYNVILERRLYDYWDFWGINNHLDRGYFFSKYPQISYIVEYDRSFFKVMSPIIGMPAIVQGLPFNKNDRRFFRKTHQQGHITVYQIDRELVTEVMPEFKTFGKKNEPQG